MDVKTLGDVVKWWMLWPGPMIPQPLTVVETFPIALRVDEKMASQFSQLMVYVWYLKHTD